MGELMKAIYLEQPCNSNDLIPVKLPRPIPKGREVLVKIKAFSVNESEVTSRKGESSSDFSFPRILGIEGVGIIQSVPEKSIFKEGQQVATMMEGLGRSKDGSYAEYMVVQEDNLIPFESELNWEVLGAIPEMLQTAYGSLTKGLQIKQGDTLLIRGGTSTVGLMAAIIAKHQGTTVISTSRRSENISVLNKYGADYPLIDDEMFENNVKQIMPNGVDKILELVGFTTLYQNMKLLKQGGMICFTGALSDRWTEKDFSPFSIPSGMYLTSYAGGVRDLPSYILNDFLDLIEVGNMPIPIGKIYHGLESVAQAHKDLEEHRYKGKCVVVI
ncbi:alcohol dehydrogenase [Staphylococcus xylosus]|uniref:alcohol dehydrogenase catalytic domain-containing protein n=1 Tax=Staphylococcus xylosus TaxID=1288 RepID=UPI0008698491|nr:zinc-binding dehydrogenase [Staphylococcus xylosus]SCU23638.1 alcohol dehydrogenase [Staphylococcus xylosus]